MIPIDSTNFSSHVSPPPPATRRFEDLGLIPPLLRAVKAEGYEVPTPIQERAIPHVLAGKDLLGCAQTGTGKTAAFVLPIVQRLSLSPRARQGHERPHIRALVLSPTRELASQIGQSFADYGRYAGLEHTVIFGGVGEQPQTAALRRGVDILIATPGRLNDLMARGLVRFSRLEIFVLDEADRMLDQGFLPAVRRIIATLPRERQTLFFSATMPPEIEPLANEILRDPVRVLVGPVAATSAEVDQSIYFVEQRDKRALLQHLLGDASITRAVVFTRTKHGADRVATQLAKDSVRAEAIHGNKSQGARERALARFRAGSLRVLVATDIAARGIDIDGVSHVINYDLPNEPESYVHRIGRTARAGARGSAVSFCSTEEHRCLSNIERLIKRRVPVVGDHPYRSSSSAKAPPRRPGPGQGGRRVEHRWT